MPIFKHRLPAGLALTLAFAVPAAGAADPVLLVTAPAALQIAEKSGAGFAHWTGETAASPDGITTNQALMRTPAWQSIARPLGESLARIQRSDRQAGVDAVFDKSLQLEAFYDFCAALNITPRR